MTRAGSPWLLLLIALAGACSNDTPPPATGAAGLRVVTLAPNLAELVYAAGAGETLVGVSAWSDYPPAVAALPQVGDAFAVDEERLTLLQPDLLLAWQSGTPAHLVDDLRAAGYRVETIRTRGLDDVPAALQRIGELTGYAAEAEAAAAAFTAQLEDIGSRHAGRADVRVFYQVSARPLYTVNGDHYVSELIDLCGGSNVFADLSELAPTVDVEAVLERDPEALLASTDAGGGAFEVWQRWAGLAANRYGNRFLMPADEIGRATPRLVAAARAVCAALDQARANRDAAAAVS